MYERAELTYAEIQEAYRVNCDVISLGLKDSMLRIEHIDRNYVYVGGLRISIGPGAIEHLIAGDLILVESTKERGLLQNPPTVQAIRPVLSPQKFGPNCCNLVR